MMAALALAATAGPDAQAAPGPDNTTLTVQKGGDRTAPQAVAGLAGASFDFFAGVAGSPPAPDAIPVASCTTTAPTGTCSVDLPGRAGPGQGYWIRETAAPAGFTLVSTLDIGVGNGTNQTTYNQLFTGPVQNNQGYTFPVAETGGTNLFARGNFWADLRDNPPLPGECGLNIALLIDVSGSITPFLNQVKAAANGFVDALTGTPSSIALFSFATDASTVLPATTVSDMNGANIVKTAINGLTSGGATNWDAGLFQIASSSTTFDAVIMLTDGNPTVYGPPPAQGPGDRTRFREVENGIFSANAVKAEGTKIVAVGVGAGVSGALENLQSISGPVEGQDYVQTGYAELGELFHQLALKTCAGTVNVVKLVVPPGGTVDDGVPAGDWTFSVTNGNATPASGQTADGSGAVSFTADLSGGADSVPVTIQETVQAGYTLMQNNGSNATCTMGGNATPSVNAGPAGFTVDAVRDQIVTCNVYNLAPQPPATVQVTKKWVINGTEYDNPSQPAAFQAELSLTGQDTAVWGQVYGGYSAGDKVIVGETLNADLLPPNCTNEAAGDLGERILVAGANEYQVTNTVTCATTLKLLKEVQNPYGTPEPAGSWTLNAYPPGVDTPLITGQTGVSGEVEAGTKYSLGESTVDGYRQELAQGAVIVPPSTGTWHCVNALRSGPGQEFDGLNGTVTPQLGNNVECTAVNIAQPAKLTLKKSVTNGFGGTAEPADWILNATPDSDDPVITGRDSEPAVTGVPAIPNVNYTLTEADGPPGYEMPAAPTCVLTGTNTSVPAPGGVLTPAVGQDITCTFTNLEVSPAPSASPSASPSAPPSASPSQPASPSTSPSGPPIPITGTPIAPMAAAGAVALMSGLGLLLLVRRRRWTESDT